MSVRLWTLSKWARLATYARPRLSTLGSQTSSPCPPLPVEILNSSQQRSQNLTPKRWNSNSTNAGTTEEPFSNQERIGPSQAEPSFSLTACPGCGALAQTVEPGAAGYYHKKRKAVSEFVAHSSGGSKTQEQDVIISQALEAADSQLLDSLGLNPGDAVDSPTVPPLEHPFCDRCHGLIHHHVGVPIAHPSIDSLADTISESPHKYNHIYHVLDAADFPLSLVSSLHRMLSASEQRSRNRRSKRFKYSGGKVTEVTFVITRSDLLAPKKEQVDTLMPYLVQVLRDSLGHTGKNVRLGNVCCVSAKRGWWVKQLKADIWQRGGAGWMVGKVNVGKSNLFEVAFPKGKADDINLDSVRSRARHMSAMQPQHGRDKAADAQVLQDIQRDWQQDEPDEDSLLPPVRAETPYPVMPTISSLPGTTASPIRIPFGNGKGELIDLPGLARGDLEKHVKPEHRESVLMKHRLIPEQYVIKPGSSLVLGGLIRITPRDPDVVILAYPFVNLSPHLTSTSKAEAIQNGTSESGLRDLVTTDSAKACMASAGTFQLQWDVTRKRAGPLTAKSAAGLKPKTLPFVILSADILIEGIGWVELVAQVRKRRPQYFNTLPSFNDATRSKAPKGTELRTEISQEPTHFPEIEVFSPEGKSVAVRRPMNAWVLGGLQSKPGKALQKSRPRKSMRSSKGSGARLSDARSAVD